ncbi:hypothetical protein [Christiangramia portivictoriae]|uniref:hypothetical protein n=1 Tax=Christiangramia portivictoriae TaxID=326069 RepID=UPI0004173C64|nr:hypothetical protein [Christiangramia portivictoriae]
MNKKVSINKELIILLTGTIYPNSTSMLAVKDPVTRKKQYLEAVNFYLEKTSNKIVFVENSNFEFTGFPRNPERIEYLSFQSPKGASKKGKGFQELKIMEYGFDNSRFLKQTSSIIKITGRLKVLNINTLAKRFKDLNKSFANLIYADPFAVNNVDARCFMFNLSFWHILKKTGNLIDEKHNYNFELALWDAIYLYELGEDNHFKPIPIPIRIMGISGSFGNTYKYNLFVHYIRYIKKFYNVMSHKSRIDIPTGRRSLEYIK